MVGLVAITLLQLYSINLFLVEQYNIFFSYKSANKNIPNRDQGFKI